MDSAVLAALARWPNVPDVYGWLRLDRRGQWRLQNEVLSHPGLVDFIGRNYTHDELGRWYFQNGPQRVFLQLDYTPWVLHLAEDGFVRHTGQALSSPTGAWMDEDGSLLLGFEDSVGLVCDRDLPHLLPRFASSNPHGPRAESALEKFLEDPAYPLVLAVAGGSIPVGRIKASALPERFGFNPSPSQTLA